MSLLDFLQSASNAVAGNVTGPVDLITLALRKAGVPVPEDAVGTSAWAKGKGLVRDVEPGAARVAGETAGILGPMLAVHYAPQIARSLLKAAENAAAPRTLNPQTGAIVWHGSPHKFDKFDSSKIGTGEGAQAYGHGLYLAENPAVANDYAGSLSAARATKPVGNVDLTQVYQSLPNDVPEAVMSSRRDFNALRDMGVLSNADRRDFLEAVRNNFNASQGGNLYKVDLPDEAIARMLDWDKPLSQQPSLLQALRNSDAAGIGGQSVGWRTAPDGMWERAAASPSKTGEWLYRDIADNDPTRTVETLRQLGIPGIRYLDGGSRAAGQGTSNYVVFPGNEDLLTILERNGIPIR